MTDYQSELAKSEATLKAIVEKEMTRDQKDFDNANNNFNQTLEDSPKSKINSKKCINEKIILKY